MSSRLFSLLSLLALTAVTVGLAGCGPKSTPVATGTVTQYNPPPAVVNGPVPTTTQAAPPPSAPVSTARPKLGEPLACQKIKPHGPVPGFRDAQAVRRIKAAFSAAYSAGVAAGKWEDLHTLVRHLHSPDVRFKVESGAAACAADSDLAVFDPRSDAGWLVIYLHSDSHAVFRLIGNVHGRGELVRLDRPGKVTAVKAG